MSLPSTEPLPELWSPMTAMAGKAVSCSTPRARRESAEVNAGPHLLLVLSVQVVFGPLEEDRQTSQSWSLMDSHRLEFGG